MSPLSVSKTMVFRLRGKENQTKTKPNQTHREGKRNVDEVESFDLPRCPTSSWPPWST